MSKFFNKIIRRQSAWKAKLLLPHLNGNESVLDFGCGDLSFAKELKKNIPNLAISGADIVNFPKRPKNIPLVVYDGKKLPFKNNSFDTVISFYVFHHCENVEELFAECFRVARKRVIIVESLPRYKAEIPAMRFLDWITNVWKSEEIPLPFAFFPLKKWKRVIKKNGGSIANINQFGNSLFRLLPLGGQYIIVVKKIR